MGNTFQPLLTKTAVIDSNLLNKEYYFVTLDTSDADFVVNIAANANAPVFILQEGVDGSTTEGIGSVCMQGFFKVKLGGTVSRGDKLTSDSSGLAIATVTDKNNFGAIALEGGVANDIIEVLVVQGMVSAT